MISSARSTGKRPRRLATVITAAACAAALAGPSLATQALASQTLAAPSLTDAAMVPLSPLDVTAPHLTVGRYLSFELFRTIGSTADVTTIHDPCSRATFHHFPVWVRWRGTDPGGGPVTFDLFKHDPGNLAQSKLIFGNATLPMYDYVFTDQQSIVCQSTPDQIADLHHLFRVVAKDAAGNTASVGPFSHTPLFSIQETGPQVRTSSTNPPVPSRGPLGAVANVRGFTRIAVAGADAGHRLTSTHVGDRVKYTATTGVGEYVALAGPVGVGRGKFKVTVDGSITDIVDTGNTTDRTLLIIWQRALTAGHHTIVVKNLGTPGRPRVDIDAVLAS